MHLSATQLEQSPSLCLRLMKAAAKSGQTVDMSTVPCLYNWGAGLVGTLAMLVGRLEIPPTFTFFGSGSAIDDSLGAELLDVGLRLGADLHMEDNLGEQPQDMLRSGLATSRRDNVAFKRRFAAELVARSTTRGAMSHAVTEAACLLDK